MKTDYIEGTEKTTPQEVKMRLKIKGLKKRGQEEDSRKGY